MANIFKLTRVLLKESLVGFNKSGKKSGKLQKSLMIIVALSLLPSLLSLGFLGATIYQDTVAIDQAALAVTIAFNTVASLTLISAFFVTPAVLYFAKDIPSLLPLPLKSYEIITAKMMVTYLFELALISLFALPYFVGYTLAASPGLFFCLALVFSLLLLPVVPLLVATLANILIMAFSGLFKNQDRFNFLASIILLVGVFFYLNTMQYVTSPDSASLLVLLGQGNDSLSALIGVFLPTIAWLSRFVTKADFSALLLALGFSLVFCLLFYLAAEKLYFIGVLRVSNTAGKKEKLSTDKLRQATKSHNPLIAYWKKDFIILCRTPMYFLNCLVPPLLIPLLLIFTLIVGLSNGELSLPGLDELSKFILEALPSTALFAVFSGFIIGVFNATLNSIAITALTREGDNFGIMKQFPVDLFKQLEAKMLLGSMLSLFVALAYNLAILWLFKLIFIDFIMMLLAAVLGIMLLSYLALLIDILHPKLTWTNEAQAVKQNINIVIFMLGTWALLALFIMVSLKLVNLLSSYLLVALLLIAAGLLTLSLRYFCQKASLRLAEITT